MRILLPLLAAAMLALSAYAQTAPAGAHTRLTMAAALRKGERHA